MFPILVRLGLRQWCTSVILLERSRSEERGPRGPTQSTDSVCILTKIHGSRVVIHYKVLSHSRKLNVRWDGD